MKRNIWTSLVIFSLVLFAFTSVVAWGQSANKAAEKINNSLMDIAVQTMKQGAELFAPLLKQYNVTLNFAEVNYLFGEDGETIITLPPIVIPQLSEPQRPDSHRRCLGLVFVSGSDFTKEIKVNPGWYMIVTQIEPEEKEWKTSLLDANGKIATEFIAPVGPAEEAYLRILSLGVRAQVCMDFHIWHWSWCHVWHLHWGHWASCCH